jgi:hypothetical protein
MAALSSKAKTQPHNTCPLCCPGQVWRFVWSLIGCDCQKKKKAIAMKVLET